MREHFQTTDVVLGFFPGSNSKQIIPIKSVRTEVQQVKVCRL